MRALIVCSCLLVVGLARADWLPADGDEVQQQAYAAEQRFRAWHDGRLQTYFDEAYGYAIYYNLTRGGFMIGGGYGKGVVIEAGSFAGYTSQWRASVGLQLGVQNLVQVVFFRDARALRAFQQGTLEFDGLASVSLLTLGASFDPAFNPRVAIFTLTRFGLMVEISAAAAGYRYSPVTPMEVAD